MPLSRFPRPNTSKFLLDGSREHGHSKSMQVFHSLFRLSLLATLVMATSGCRDGSGAGEAWFPEVSPAIDVMSLPPMSGDGVRVLVFVRVDCPISNRYAPEIRRISQRYADSVAWWLVYPNPRLSAAEISDHMQEYGYPGRPFHDRDQALVEFTGATITPEAAVYDGENQLVYCGRIDDLYVELGKRRPKPTQHDLEDAIQATLSGEPVTSKRQAAVGCYIKDLAASNVATD